MKTPTREQLAKDIDSGLTWAEIALKYGYSDSRFLRKLRVRYGLPQRKKILKPTPEELRQMICEEHLAPKEIARRLGYGDEGYSNIYAYCREYNIPVNFQPHRDLRERPFTEEQRAIVLGTLLGDGYLRRAGVNYRLVLTHGYKQRDYLEWKYQHLKPYILINTPRASKPNNFNSLGSLSYWTIAHPWLTSLRELCYPNNRKTITTTWLDTLTPLSLAVWVMDDGSLNRRYGTMVLCTMSFCEEEHQLMQKWFIEKFGIEPKIERRRNNQFVLRFNTREASILREIIAPHVPDCMRYKVELPKS